MRPEARTVTDLEAARLSEICYLGPDLALPAADGLGFSAEPVFSGETEAYIFRRGSEVVVGFRGTSSLTDALTDLRIRRKNVRSLGVHDGFWSYVERVFEPLLDGIGGADDIHVTGHSLGAAAAQVFAFQLRIRSAPLRGVVTFGGPRVGDRGWKLEYNSFLGDITRRYRRVLDPVPHLPPRRWGFRHTSGERYIDRNGKIHEHIGWWSAAWDKLVAGTAERKFDGKPDFLAAHGVSGYVEALQRDSKHV
jgi:triacylglycerol lipase